MKGGNQGERKRTFYNLASNHKVPSTDNKLKLQAKKRTCCCTEENRELGNLRREKREKISHNSEGKTLNSRREEHATQQERQELIFFLRAIFFF